MKRILIACEYSGRVRDAFNRLGGFEAVSCDLLPTDVPGKHYVGDVKDLLESKWKFDAMICFPPCTYLCSSGLHWNKRGRGEQPTEDALAFVRYLLDAPVKFIALENPVGCISSRIRKPDQIIQPYNFGEDASKKTCLWLKSLPPLASTGYCPPRIIAGKERWANQTDSGQNKLGPSDERWKLRSETFQGIADAMAAQWGPIILNS